MIHFSKIFLWCALTILCSHSAFALEQADCDAIQSIVQDYTDAWNERQGKGFADHFPKMQTLSTYTACISQAVRKSNRVISEYCKPF